MGVGGLQDVTVAPMVPTWPFVRPREDGVVLYFLGPVHFVVKKTLQNFGKILAGFLI